VKLISVLNIPLVQISSSFYTVSRGGKTCWLLSIWSQMVLHGRTVEKNVLDPCAAPCENDNRSI